MPLLKTRDIKKQTVINIQNILNYFEVTYRLTGQRIVMACPIHGGDNDSGCCIFLDGQNIVGNWKCWTNSCEETYGRGILGFVRGLLSKNSLVTFEYTEEWLHSFFESNKTILPMSTQEIVKPAIEPVERINKMQFRNQMVIPAKYYLERGYKRETLNKFDVGLCLNKKNSFYMRIVVPVYDEFGYNVIGQVARSQNSQCPKCLKYHFSNKSCPTNNLEKYWAEKWLNSKGFGKSVTLYNIWNAKNFVQTSKKMILVEGQGDVWRLDEAGIYNTVGMFGLDLNATQCALLDKLGIKELIILTDNDDAGTKGYKKIYNKYKNKYKIRQIKFSTKDIGEMTVEQINKEIKPFI